MRRVSTPCRKASTFATIPLMVRNGERTILPALAVLGFEGAGDVRVGRAIELAIDAASPEAAEAAARKMCERLLANPVTEDYEIIFTLDKATPCC